MKRIISLILAVLMMLCLFGAVLRAEEEIDISVIIPVYNVEEFLAECLDSVINQTKKNIEIICVNDGSKDSSLEILKKYAKEDGRIIIVDKPNGGVSSARNAGIEAATGKYIAFVDSDDIIKADTYKIAFDYAERYNADIVCFGWYNFPEGSCGRNDCKPEYHVYTDWYKAKQQRESINIWNKLYRRELIIESGVRFNEQIRYAEDECFNLCLYPKCRTIVHMPKVMYGYRVREGSATFDSFCNKIKNYINVWKYVVNVWEGYGVKHIGAKIVACPMVYGKEIIPFIRSCF